MRHSNSFAKKQNRRKKEKLQVTNVTNRVKLTQLDWVNERHREDENSITKKLKLKMFFFLKMSNLL